MPTLRRTQKINAKPEKHVSVQPPAKSHAHTPSKDKSISSTINTHTKGMIVPMHLLSPYAQRRTLFPKPTRVQKQKYGLARIIHEIAPCAHIRRIRRGRKVFQVPCVIPERKRRLFGIQRILTLHRSLQSGDKSIVTQDIKTETPVENLHVSGKTHCQRETNLLLHFRQSARVHNKFFLSSLTYSLRSAINACGIPKGKALLSKKQAYRNLFANRGSIRLSWWL